MRRILLSISTLCLSISAFAFEPGTYRPGAPYNKMQSQDPSMCATQCMRDMQCQGWNFVKQDARAPVGLCEFNSQPANPVRSQISISGSKGQPQQNAMMQTPWGGTQQMPRGMAQSRMNQQQMAQQAMGRNPASQNYMPQNPMANQNQISMPHAAAPRSAKLMPSQGHTMSVGQGNYPSQAMQGQYPNPYNRAAQNPYTGAANPYTRQNPYSPPMQSYSGQRQPYPPQGSGPDLRDWQHGYNSQRDGVMQQQIQNRRTSVKDWMPQHGKTPNHPMIGNSRMQAPQMSPANYRQTQGAMPPSQGQPLTSRSVTPQKNTPYASTSQQINPYPQPALAPNPTPQHQARKTGYLHPQTGAPQTHTAPAGQAPHNPFNIRQLDMNNRNATQMAPQTAPSQPAMVQQQQSMPHPTSMQSLQNMPSTPSAPLYPQVQSQNRPQVAVASELSPQGSVGVISDKKIHSLYGSLYDDVNSSTRVNTSPQYANPNEPIQTVTSIPSQPIQQSMLAGPSY